MTVATATELLSAQMRRGLENLRSEKQALLALLARYRNGGNASQTVKLCVCGCGRWFVPTRKTMVAATHDCVRRMDVIRKTQWRKRQHEIAATPQTA